MFPDDVLIGTRLELEILENGQRVGPPYVSQILEYQEDGNMVISTPIHEARLVHIPEESSLRLSFTHKKHGLLAFMAASVKQENRENISVLIVKPTSELFRHQRRSNYRLEYTADVLMKVSATPEFRPPATEIKAHTKNISGSGLCVVSDVEIPKDSDVTVELQLPMQDKIIAKCHVVRTESFLVRKSRRYHLGMHFYDISKKDQERLIRFIFEQQRLLLKRGLI